jgi:AraC-like DNA-binding protein
LSPVVTSVFQGLRVAASVWEHGGQWFPLFSAPSGARFEEAQGTYSERIRYNEQSFDRVLRTKARVRGAHAGFSDAFVPIIVKTKVVGILVVGPFALHRPRASEVIERWSAMTGRKPELADPAFASYLSFTLSTLLLEGRGLQAFDRALECLTRLMAGEADAGKLASEVSALRGDLEECRFVEHMWEATFGMIDDIFGARWHTAHRRQVREELGLTRVGDNVLVALTVGGTPGRDPIDEAICHHQFQRAACELARKVGDVTAGRVGEHGVVFLSGTTGSVRARERAIHELSERARLLARELDLTIHCGATIGTNSVPLSSRYHAALGAAEAALVRKSRLIIAEENAALAPPALGPLRKSLRKVAREDPKLLASHFDRYVELVAAHSVEQIDVAKAHLEVAFEGLTDTLSDDGVLPPRSLSVLSDALAHQITGARSVPELVAAYRRAVEDLAKAASSPVPARQDRSLRAALDLMQRRYSDPLTLTQVARVAGFAPGHFSRLFKRREGVTFESYLLGLRLGQAKKLLIDRQHNVTRIAVLTGFGSVHSFCRAFAREVGKTPLEYRRRESPKAHKVKNKDRQGQKR